MRAETSQPTAMRQSHDGHDHATGPAPKAAVDSTLHDFGKMAFGGRGEHTFTIRNEGDAELTLKLAEVSCKCTEAVIEKESLQPRESAAIRVAWKAEEELQVFKQWLRVQTNDPHSKEVVLKIEGLIRDELRLEPAELDFGEIPPPDTQKTVEAVVLSDESETLSLESVAASNPGFTVEAQALTPEQLQQHKARGGYVLRVSSPSDLPSGSFGDTIAVRAKVEETGKVRNLTVPLHGRVLGRLSVFGAGVDQFGSVMFGTLAYGKGKTIQLTVKLRDTDPELKVSNLVVEPQFVKVELKPHPNQQRAGLYDLTVEIPPETEPCAYRVGHEGRIHFEFDHPRVKKLDLKVDFSVRPPPEIPVAR